LEPIRSILASDVEQNRMERELELKKEKDLLFESIFFQKVK